MRKSRQLLCTSLWFALLTVGNIGSPVIMALMGGTSLLFAASYGMFLERETNKEKQNEK